MPATIARRADRAGADADLDRVDAERRSALRSLPRSRRCRRPGRRPGYWRRSRFTMSSTPCEWPCAVSTTSTSTCAATSASARSSASRADADRRADAQPPERVLARVRVLDHLLDVLDGDQPLEHVTGRRRPAASRPCAGAGISRACSSVVPTGTVNSGSRVMMSRDRPIEVRLEPQVAVGQDADQPAFLAAVLGDRHARDAVLLHQVERFEDPVGRRQRDRVDDHAALGPLDAIDLRRLFLDRQVLVDDADAALLRHRDRQPRLGDGVHRRAEQRHVDADVARDPGR